MRFSLRVWLQCRIFWKISSTLSDFKENISNAKCESVACSIFYNHWTLEVNPNSNFVYYCNCMFGTHVIIKSIDSESIQGASRWPRPKWNLLSSPNLYTSYLHSLFKIELINEFKEKIKHNSVLNAHIWYKHTLLMKIY